MKPAKFAYHAPADLEAALTLLGDLSGDCKILAGGQSLIPAMNFRLARPGAIVDINDLSELEYVREDTEGTLHIGALTRHATFHRPAVKGPIGALLTNVVKYIGHYPIRQRGTFGGSISHADPASEWCLVATTLGAQMVIRSRRGERTIPASSFFQGIFTTALAEDEILTEIQFPPLADEWRTGFYEFSRRKGDFALAMSLAALRVSEGRIMDARLGVGGVSDRSVKLDALESALIGKTPTPATFQSVAREARQMIEPFEDIHASAEYRRDLIATVVGRALAEAAA